MIIKRNGCTRIVFVFKNFVIKIPNFSVEHSHFLAGCKANWDERAYWKYWRKTEGLDLKDKVVPTLFSTWFGLIQIQARANILANHEHLSEEQVAYFSFTTDIKASNFGYYKGRLVCVDYG